MCVNQNEGPRGLGVELDHASWDVVSPLDRHYNYMGDAQGKVQNHQDGDEIALSLF